MSGRENTKKLSFQSTKWCIHQVAFSFEIWPTPLDSEEGQQKAARKDGTNLVDAPLSKSPKVFAQKLFEFMLDICGNLKVQQNSVSLIMINVA